MESNNFQVDTSKYMGEFVNGVELDDYWCCWYKVKCDLRITKTARSAVSRFVGRTTQEDVVLEIPGVWDMGNLIAGIKWKVGEYVREKYPDVKNVVVYFKVFEKRRGLENVDNWNDGEEEEEEEENDF